MLPTPEILPFDERTFGHGVFNEETHATPSSTLCDTHYAMLGIQGAWDSDRVLRLCGLLQMTRYELASLMMFPHRQMKKCMETGLFPGTVCLMMTLVENTCVPKGYLMDAIPGDEETPLIPNEKMCNGPN